MLCWDEGANPRHLERMLVASYRRTKYIFDWILSVSSRPVRCARLYASPCNRRGFASFPLRCRAAAPRRNATAPFHANLRGADCCSGRNLYGEESDSQPRPLTYGRVFFASDRGESQTMQARTRRRRVTVCDGTLPTLTVVLSTH